MGTVATDNLYSKYSTYSTYSKCSMYSTRPRKSRTSIACPQPPGCPQPADSGHMRGEYYVFPATAVQKPWPKQRHGHN